MPPEDMAEFLPLIAELRRLVASGHGDSRAAEAIRSRMYTPWDRMTREEQEQAGRIDYRNSLKESP